MIYLSMSLIRDFLDCPNKLSFRAQHHDGDHVPKKEMVEGTIVHTVLEKGWKSKELAKVVLNSELHAISSSNIDVKKISKCIDNFFLMYSGILSSDDKIEQYFKVPYSKDVTFVGKFDRIHGNTVYDWKSGAVPPEDLDRDVQFMLYYLAYKRIYKREPSALVYVSLLHKRNYLFHPVPNILNEFEKELLPFIVAEAKKKEHPRLGLLKYGTCNSCAFKTSCWRLNG